MNLLLGVLTTLVVTLALGWMALTFMVLSIPPTDIKQVSCTSQVMVWG